MKYRVLNNVIESKLTNPYAREGIQSLIVIYRVEGSLIQSCGWRDTMQ